MSKELRLVAQPDGYKLASRLALEVLIQSIDPAKLPAAWLVIYKPPYKIVESEKARGDE